MSAPIPDWLDGAKRMDVATESDANLATMIGYLDGRADAILIVRRIVADEIDRRAVRRIEVDCQFAGVELRDAFDTVFNGPRMER